VKGRGTRRKAFAATSISRARRPATAISSYADQSAAMPHSQFPEGRACATDAAAIAGGPALKRRLSNRGAPGRISDSRRPRLPLWRRFRSRMPRKKRPFFVADDAERRLRPSDAVPGVFVDLLRDYAAWRPRNGRVQSALSEWPSAEGEFRILAARAPGALNATLVFIGSAARTVGHGLVSLRGARRSRPRPSCHR